MKRKRPPRNRPNQVIVLTGGDPAGIGPELIESILPEITDSKKAILYFFTSDKKFLNHFMKRAGNISSEFQIISYQEYSEIVQSDKIDSLFLKCRRILVDLSGLDVYRDWSLARPGKGSGLLAFEALRLACDFIQKYGCLGLCTAPLSKEWVAKGTGKKFAGHTDYLAERFNSKVLMLMHGKKISVIPLTVHIPLAKVSKELEKIVKSPVLISQLTQIQRLKIFRKKRWALCGVNPHSGEGGHIGKDEVRYLDSIGIQWRDAGLPVDGPMSADAVFLPEAISQYRLVFSAYHDQGLIPFKALEGKSGINVTLGLPFIRSSPDHGTAFGIAEKRKADPESMRNAFYAVCDGELKY